jgi:hypothetical protein
LNSILSVKNGNDNVSIEDNIVLKPTTSTCNQEDKENSGGKESRLQEPCEFPESANFLSSTSVHINEEFSKPTTSVCNQEDKENAGGKESQLQELYEFPVSRTPKITYRPVYRLQQVNRAYRLGNRRGK